MKWYNSAGVHWRIALIEFLCSSGPDGKSPSDLLGRQFRGILPMVDSCVNINVDFDCFTDRKFKEKEIFDHKHNKELKPLIIDTTLSYLNADLNTCSIDAVKARTTDNTIW